SWRLMRADSLQDDDTDPQAAITKVVDFAAEASTDYDDTEFGGEAESPIIGAMALDDEGTPEEREDIAEEIDEAATRTEAASIAEAAVDAQARAHSADEAEEAEEAQDAKRPEDTDDPGEQGDRPWSISGPSGFPCPCSCRSSAPASPSSSRETHAPRPSPHPAYSA